MRRTNAPSFRKRWGNLIALRPRPEREMRLLLKTKRSLTQLCLQKCQYEFQVKTLQQHHARANLDESMLLKRPQRERCFIRRVVLCCGPHVILYARTVIPQRTISGRRRRFLHLGNKSLGAFLFRFHNLQRYAAQYRIFTADAFPQWSPYPVEHDIYARRHAYRIYRHPLLVTECFMDIRFMKVPTLL